MKEPGRALLVAAVSAIVLTISGLRISRSTASDPPSPRFSPEKEEERTKAMLRHLSQPEVRRERQLSEDLVLALHRYWVNRSTFWRERCESLLDKILALPKPSAKAYCLCATSANVLDRPRQAITILKKAIAEYPEEDIGAPILPLKVSGYYRIGAIATRTGDANEAVRAYETIVKNSDGSEGKEYHEAMSCMYLAEIDRRTPGRERLAAERLRKVVSSMGKTSANAQHPSARFAFELMRNWAAYELARLEYGSVPCDLRADPNTAQFGASFFMLVMTWPTISCPSLPEMQQMAESDHPSILRTLARLVLATDCLHRSDPFQAETHLLSVAQGDSYFKPQVEVMLDDVREKMKKIRDKIPGLLHDLQHGSGEQRRQAVSTLVYGAGSEGIEVLQKAQQDPNKYVRYAAACALASQTLDLSAKPDFPVILEAFTDEDPQIRNEAGSAVSLPSCLEVGPEEAVALVRLMREHYSEELRLALDGLLFTARMDILDAAVPELMVLRHDENEDVREGVLDLLGRITDGLAQRIEIEDEAVQVRILGMLSRMGPAARRAAHVLTKYSQHDNIDIRNAALDVLRNLPPTQAGQDHRPFDGP